MPRNDNAVTVLGIYGSPRKGGNTDLLLDAALEAAEAQGARVLKVYARRLKISGCIECGGCDETGKCVLDDRMQEVYPLFHEADAVILSAPVFFYGVPAQCKALVDRAQAEWARRLLKKTTPEDRKVFDSGRGYLIATGATKGKNLFLGVELCAQYFYDALDMTYQGSLTLRGVEKKGEVSKDAEAMEEARRLGREAVRGGPFPGNAEHA